MILGLTRNNFAATAEGPIVEGYYINGRLKGIPHWLLSPGIDVSTDSEIVIDINGGVVCALRLIGGFVSQSINLFGDVAFWNVGRQGATAPESTCFKLLISKE